MAVWIVAVVAGGFVSRASAAAAAAGPAAGEGHGYAPATADAPATAGASSHGEASHALTYPHPALPPAHQAWPGAMVLIVAGMFLAAAAIGIVVDLNMPDEPPPDVGGHGHDDHGHGHDDHGHGSHHH
jgi:hypothetical protein